MWAQIVAALLGIWLMAAPSLLGYDGAARLTDWIAGPLVASVAVVATAGVTRSVRWALLPLGGLLAVAPWLLGFDVAPTVNHVVAGLLLIGLAFVRGQVREHYDGGWKALFTRPWTRQAGPR